MNKHTLDHMKNADRPPIFVGAGVIRSEDQILNYAHMPKLAVQIIGSFSENEWGGSDPEGQKLVFYWDETARAAYNAIGLRNPGRKAASEYLPRSIRAVHDMGQIAIIGVTALGHEDPTEVIPRMVEWGFEMGADGVEINGSCPNEKYHILMCESHALTCETVGMSRGRVGADKFLLIKMSALSRQAIRVYGENKPLVDAIDAINNCRRMSPLNPRTSQPYIEVNEGNAGQSGPAISDLARSNLVMWKEETAYDVWSIGGLEDGYEIYDRVHNLGATMAGGAQELYRSNQPSGVIYNWVSQYEEACIQRPE